MSIASFFVSLPSDLQNTLGAGLLGGVTYLGSKLGQLIGLHVKDKRARSVLDTIQREALTVASAVAKTYVDGLRTDGKKLEPEQAAKAKADALALLRHNLGPAKLKDIARQLGKDAGVDGYLHSKLEEAVRQLPKR